MTEIATRMRGLALLNEGYAAPTKDYGLESLSPYVAMREFDVPKPGPSQVLVRVRLASINPSDVMFVKGLYGQPRVKGQPAGFEGVGEVVAAGDAPHARALLGKRVAIATGASGWGSWADYAVAEAAVCIPLMDGVSDVDGAAMIVNPLTAIAMFGLVRDAGEKAFVATAAASQLCKLLIQVAADAGYRPIGIVRRADQIAPLKALGAVEVIDATDAAYETELSRVFKAEKPRIFLDAVTGPVAASVFRAMGRGARWIIYGRLDAEPTIIHEPGQMIFQDKKVEGFWLTEWMRSAGREGRERAIGEAQKRFVDGSWKTDVTAIVPLDEAIDRVAGELGKPNGKVFIRP